jgi:hypothetical protein
MDSAGIQNSLLSYKNLPPLGRCKLHQGNGCVGGPDENGNHKRHKGFATGVIFINPEPKGQHSFSKLTSGLDQFIREGHRRIVLIQGSS